MTFGEKLLHARLVLNLSQKELAEKAGITERSVYNYEQTSTYPNQSIINKLAEALNITVTYLMDDESDTPEDIDQKLFLANVKNEFGPKGAREASAVLSRASALFAGGELEDEAKDVFYQSLMEVYLESKGEAREKFSPRKRASRKK